jgi:hypothetical protein
VATDRGGDRPARLARVLDLAVGESQEVHRLHAEHARRVALLLLANAGQALGGHAAVGRTLVAVGDDAVRHLQAFAHEPGDGAAGAELGVVGMGGDDQHPLDRRGPGRIGHGERSFRAFILSSDRVG